MCLYHLVSRGYSYRKVRSIRHCIAYTDRLKLLPYKTKSDPLPRTNSLVLKLPFDRNFILKDKLTINSKNLTIINSIQPNLSQLLIHNFPIQKIKNFGCKPCNSSNCKKCKFVNTNNYFKLDSKFIFVINTNSTCATDNCIYIIICKKCNVFYIGETSQTIRNRMNNHFHTLRNSNFKTNDQAKMVIPDHFKLMDHDYETHFSFTIIKQGLVDSRYRFGFEQEFIHFFKANHRILNINIPTLRTKSIFNLFSND